MPKDLRWHATRKITEGILSHPLDSPGWRTIDEKFSEIAKDPRNLRLGISTDGVMSTEEIGDIVYNQF